jgi:hypothetical protein
MCWIDGGEGTSNINPRVTTGATANTIFSDYYVEDASSENPKYSIRIYAEL